MNKTMVQTKRAQTRKNNNLRKTWGNLNQNSGNGNSTSQDLSPMSPNFNRTMTDLPPELANLKPEEQLAALEALSQLQEMEQMSPQPKLSVLPKSPQNPAIGSGVTGSVEEPDASDLTVPLSGKHLKQKKELMNVAGAVVAGLVVAGKTSKNDLLIKDASVVAKYGEEIAQQWALLGRKYSWLYDVLDKFCAGSFLTMALMPMYSMFSEIAQNHGIEVPSIAKAA